VAVKPTKENEQKLEAASTKTIDQVLRWGHSLATSPADEKYKDGYFRTIQYQQLHNTISSKTTRTLALTGAQGVGKTAALVRLHHDLSPSNIHNSLLMNWGDKNEQTQAILNSDNEFFMFDGSKLLNYMYRDLLFTEFKNTHFAPIKLPKGKLLPDSPRDLDIQWAEKTLGKARCRALREEAWFKYLSLYKIILIDLPDYARTDRRLLTRHLNQIYKLWIKLGNLGNPPTLVIAIQKDFIGGHSFFGKMDKIELHPFSTDQLVTSYRANFQSTFPFTETALRSVASRSRGNYRRFKRYVALAIESYPQNATLNPISDEHVRRVISTDRVAEDLDVELERLFPKNPDSRQQAVRIMLHLSDSGPIAQGKLGKALGIAEHTLSRLLSDLELHRYITRQACGLRKIVSLVEL